MLEGRIVEALRALHLRGGRLLVAVSGGVDSSVLLHLLAESSDALAIELAAGHVNHGLRGPGSEADEGCARRSALALGLPFYVTRVEPGRLRRDRGSRERPTLQEAARRLRHDALDAQARAWGAHWVATAHTRDDQAETVLLRLLRGAGPDGLGGMAECSAEGRRVRPLLGVGRDEILAYARARGLAWREDPSNRDPAYARARLRGAWLPGLAEAFNPQLLRAIADLAEAQRRDSEWIEEAVAGEAARRFRREGRVLWMVRDGWQELPEALARRLARRALREVGSPRDVSREHIRRLLGFLRDGRRGARLEFPGGLELSLAEAGFRLAPADGREPAAAHRGASRASRAPGVPEPAACYVSRNSVAAAVRPRREPPSPAVSPGEPSLVDRHGPRDAAANPPGRVRVGGQEPA